MHIPKKYQRLQSPYVWTFTTYFAEGFPYTLIRIISSVFFRDMKVSLQAIGLTSLYGIPWVLKFLWGPQIDAYSTKRAWMLIMQGTLVALTLAVALLVSWPHLIGVVAIIFFIGSFVAATHDMAIDGYYMEALDQESQAKFVGYRVMAYRIAMMTGTGIIVTIGAMLGWTIAYLLSCLFLGMLLFYHLIMLPKVETPKVPLRRLCLSVNFNKIMVTGLFVLILGFITYCGYRGGGKSYLFRKVSFPTIIALALLLGMILFGIFKNRLKAFILRDKDSFYAKAFISFMDRPNIEIALAFIILMRVGESMLAAMVSPFLVDLGIKIHYGWISGGVGLPFSIIGAMLGGWMISRYSLKKTIWPFLLAQNLTNLIYMALAFHLQPFILINTGSETPVPIGQTNLMLVAYVHGFDQFAGGLGTSVLITFLMRTCMPEFKAAHFAIGSGLMNVSGVFSGVASGFFASWLGYGTFFGLSFAASIPGMMLIPFIPFLDSETKYA